MVNREHAQRLWNNLLELGPRRLTVLALVGLVVFLGVGGGAYYLSRPEFEVLYTGLNREDITRVSAVLRDANISFDVNAAGDTVYVHPGQTAQARTLLAEKGLPNSSSGGYELFDKIGSLGLTSFMQEITRVRALEGEIARTIQVLKGVKAARGTSSCQRADRSGGSSCRLRHPSSCERTVPPKRAPRVRSATLSRRRSPA
jgi:flagellar M-ring protein FliF